MIINLKRSDVIMNSYFRLPILIVLILIVNLFVFSCTEKQVNKGIVKVTEKEFSVTKDDKYSWSFNVRGKLKNVGMVDVEKVVLTAYCRS